MINFKHLDFAEIEIRKEEIVVKCFKKNTISELIIETPKEYVLSFSINFTEDEKELLLSTEENNEKNAYIKIGKDKSIVVKDFSSSGKKTTLTPEELYNSIIIINLKAEKLQIYRNK